MNKPYKPIRIVIADDHEMIRDGLQVMIGKIPELEIIGEAVKAAYRDDYYYCENTNAKLSQLIAGGGKILKKYPEEEKFTERELEVIHLICEEKTSKEIGAILGLQARTIESYRDSIMEKMDVKNSAGVVKYAILYQIYQVSKEKK